jgi:hypothetical protein
MSRFRLLLPSTKTVPTANASAMPQLSSAGVYVQRLFIPWVYVKSDNAFRRRHRLARPRAQKIQHGAPVDDYVHAGVKVERL